MLSLLICHTTPAKRFIWKFSKVVKLTFIELCGMKHKSSRYFYIRLKVAGVPKNVGQTGRGRAVGRWAIIYFLWYHFIFHIGGSNFHNFLLISDHLSAAGPRPVARGGAASGCLCWHPDTGCLYRVSRTMRYRVFIQLGLAGLNPTRLVLQVGGIQL